MADEDDEVPLVPRPSEPLESVRLKVLMRQHRSEWIERTGKARGWISDFKERIEASHSYVSLLYANQRSAGLQSIRAARKNFHVQARFFEDPSLGDAPDYRGFLEETRVERDSRNATHPAVEQYISEQATLGKPVTAEHAAQLRRMRFGDGGRGLTVHTVATIHRDMDDYERGLSKVVPLERAPDADPSSPSKETPRYVPPRRRT